jgi:hypothetical protein
VTSIFDTAAGRTVRSTEHAPAYVLYGTRTGLLLGSACPCRPFAQDCAVRTEAKEPNLLAALDIETRLFEAMLAASDKSADITASRVQSSGVRTWQLGGQRQRKIRPPKRVVAEITTESCVPASLPTASVFCSDTAPNWLHPGRGSWHCRVLFEVDEDGLP